MRKIPDSKLSNYIRYAANLDQNTPDLVKLSNFLFKEAEIALQG